MGDVEKERAGGFLHVDGELAGEAVADIILGAENVADFGEDLRLMLLDPEDFGDGEVGQCRVAGELDEALIADLFRQPVAFGLGARVAPDKGGAQNRAVFVEHDGAVHLSGKPNGRDGLLGLRCGGKGSANGFLRGTPPILGILLRPARMGCFEGRVFAGGSGDQLACLIHNHGARAARAHIHPKEPHSRSPLA